MFGLGWIVAVGALVGILFCVMSNDRSDHKREEWRCGGDMVVGCKRMCEMMCVPSVSDTRCDWMVCVVPVFLAYSPHFCIYFTK